MAKKRRQAFLDRFTGSCLGLMTGDALGMPVEGWPWPDIEANYHWLDALVDGRFPAGTYTDDTQMAIGLLESLIEADGFDPAVCAARWLANYQPRRGYGGRIDGLMTRLAAGARFDQVGTDSFGNGAAMRIGPLGAWFSGNETALIEAALASAAITHRHPEALAGAVCQALAVALALRSGLAGRKPVPLQFFEPLVREADRIDPPFARRLEDAARLKPADLRELRLAITELFACDVRAIESVPPALACFVLTDSFREAVSLAVNLGGDTDTVAAMTGAVAGAYHGAAAIPEEWLTGLENQPGGGRDYLVNLSRRAAPSAVAPELVTGRED